MYYPVVTTRIHGGFFKNDKITIRFHPDSVLEGRTVTLESKDRLRWYHKILECFFKILECFFKQKWADITVDLNGTHTRVFIHIEQLQNHLPQYHKIPQWAKAGKLASKLLKIGTPIQKSLPTNQKISENNDLALQPIAEPQQNQVELQSPRFSKANIVEPASLREYAEAHRKEWEEAFNKNPNLRIIKHITSLKKLSTAPRYLRRSAVPLNQALYIIRDNKHPGKIRIFANKGKMGGGEFKKVFRLEDIESGKSKVVSKTLLSVKAKLQANIKFSEAEAMKLFLGEKTILQTANSEEIGAKEYMIMKLCDLNNLDELKQKLTSAEQNQIIQDVLKAILKMHEKGYVHQDIKPSNIFLYRNKQGCIRAKLADLGFLTPMSTDSNCGSRLFYSPEKFLCEGNPAERGKSADMFAMGLALYQFINNLPESKHLFADSYNMLFRTNRPLLKTKIEDTYKKECFNPSNLVEKIVFGLLHPDPQQRWTAEQAYALFTQST